MISEPVLRSILPAQLGWSVVAPDGDGSLFRMPVVGWLCEVYLVRDEPAEPFGHLVPMTCTGTVEDLTMYALQFEGGPFVTTFETFDDEAALLAYFCREEAGRRGATA